MCAKEDVRSFVIRRVEVEAFGSSITMFDSVESVFLDFAFEIGEHLGGTRVPIFVQIHLESRLSRLAFLRGRDSGEIDPGV